MILSPFEIRYTQRSISCHWGNYTQHRHKDIDDTLDALLDGRICVEDIEPIRVVSYYGEYYSLDIRRL